MFVFIMIVWNLKMKTDGIALCQPCNWFCFVAAEVCKVPIYLSRPVCTSPWLKSFNVSLNGIETRMFFFAILFCATSWLIFRRNENELLKRRVFTIFRSILSLYWFQHLFPSSEHGKSSSGLTVRTSMFI